MELNELKACWNKLDKRLEESEIVNMRLIKEMIAQKTMSAYDSVYRHNLYNFFVTTIIICVVFPFIFMNTPISTSSFVIVETAMVIGLIPIIRKLILLAGFNLQEKKSNELSRLVLQYKKVCHQDVFWTIAVVTFAMVAFYISELCFNKAVNYVLNTKIFLVVGLTLLTFALAYVIGLWQRRRHAQQMKEIEQGLEELREFEN